MNMNTLYFLKSLGILTMITILYGCGDSGSSENRTDAKPVITLKGDNPVIVLIGSSYTDLGATATDAEDGNLTPNITMTGSVDTSTIGSYILTYQVNDSAGNSSSVTRSISVSLRIRQANPLNDTGITLGGNYPSGNNTDCVGETIGEQDCAHGRDALAATGQLSKVGGGMAGFDFTKLDANGTPLANQSQDYTTQPWACVKDNHTGLIWEVKTPYAKGTQLHSMHDSFTWYNTNPSTNGGDAGNDGYDDCTGYDVANPNSYCNTQAFVSRVNSGNDGAGLCGTTVWRLPNLHELHSIVNLGKPFPVIDENYFPNSGSYFYWSSSPKVLGTYSWSREQAWGILFYDGYDYLNSLSNDFQVRLVSSGQ